MWFLLPAFAILLVFFFLPTLFNFIYAFTDWSGFKSSINPTGLDNFTQLASDGTLFRAIRITLVYAVASSWRSCSNATTGSTGSRGSSSWSPC